LTKKAIITFKGDGFMRYMIRLIVGASLAVASNKEDLSYIESNLKEESDRNVTSYKAQGKGLILEDVIY
jgi:tRNA U38,U39,U40 pseudouridine synthase TruA